MTEYLSVNIISRYYQPLCYLPRFAVAVERVPHNATVEKFWVWEFLLVPQLRAKCNAQLATGNVQRATCSQIAFSTICIEKLKASTTIRDQCQSSAEQNRKRGKVSSVCPRKNLNKVALLVGCAGFELHCVLATRYLVGAVNLSAICIFILLYFVAAFE